ncbi:putative reverse transcriptase domain-containing protein [Tanacetum coccineum]
MTRSSTKELLTPFKEPKREFRSSRKLFKTLCLDGSRSLEYNLFSDLEENFEEEVAETMTKTMEQYMRKTRADGSDHEVANEHIEKVLEIVDLFHVPNITQDQIMLRVFLMSLTGATSHWLRNKPFSLIKTWEDLKTKFLSKYCPPARTAKKMKEINNFQQEPDETIYQTWERFKELLMKTRSTETSNELAAIQAQLNNLGREIKKVNEKVYAAQVGCEKYKEPHYTKDCPLKEEGKTLEEAYYTQFGAPFQQGEQYRAAPPGFYQRNNANPSYQEQRQSMEESLSKFMSELAKRHEKNFNLIKEIRASTDAAIRNQGALIKLWKFK